MMERRPQRAEERVGLDDVLLMGLNRFPVAGPSSTGLSGRRVTAGDDETADDRGADDQPRFAHLPGCDHERREPDRQVLRPHGAGERQDDDTAEISAVISRAA
jgi:hypothetical protein